MNFINCALAATLMFAALMVGIVMNWFWDTFEYFANDDEIPDSSLRPKYIVKELSEND